MTTENTPIQRAKIIIEEQRKMIDMYKTLISSYDKRQESVGKYLETIYALIEAGMTNPKHIKDAELGMEHLSRLITRMNKTKETA